MRYPYILFIILYYMVRWLVCLQYERNQFISFLDVGQGDTIVIHSPNYKYVLIDTGPDYQSTYLYAKYHIFPVCDVGLVIVTHSDNDHDGGLDRLRKFCPSMQMYDSAYTGMHVDLGQFRLDVISPDIAPVRPSGNDDSAVIVLKNGNFTALLTGDAGVGVLGSLTTKNSATDKHLIDDHVDIYKVPHHGSKNNTNTQLLYQLNPRLCIISVGKNNYGHPSQLLLDMLSVSGCKLLRTDRDGTIMIYF